MKGKRGRLSTIELLPDEARADVAWANEELKARNKPQKEILAELNVRLADRGIGSISKSAFNRHTLWLMGVGEHILRTREIAAVLAEKLEDVPQGDVGRLISELIKTIVFDILSNAQLNEATSMNMAVNAAIALDKLENASKINLETRLKVDKAFKKRATEAVDEVAKSAGLTPDTVLKIKSEVLGIDLTGRKKAT